MELSLSQSGIFQRKTEWKSWTLDTKKEYNTKPCSEVSRAQASRILAPTSLLDLLGIYSVSTKSLSSCLTSSCVSKPLKLRRFISHLFPLYSHAKLQQPVSCNIPAMINPPTQKLFLNSEMIYDILRTLKQDRPLEHEKKLLRLRETQKEHSI